MRFDIRLPGTNHIPGMYEWAHRLTPEDFRRILSTIDALDYHAVLVSEHLAMPTFEVPRLGGYWQDALSTMSFIAGATTRVRIDACVLVLPYHHPLRFAKAISTMDVLSGGRVGISVGVGHAEQEFAALDVPFEHRGRITDEILEAIVTLWSTDDPVHEGEFFTISGLAVEPRPVQSPHPPIIIGGNSRPALRRAARHDGWQPNPMGTSLTELAPAFEYLRAQPGYAQKADRYEIQWLSTPPDASLPTGFAGARPHQLAEHRERLLTAYQSTFVDAGVTRTVAEIPPTAGGVDEAIDYIQWFAQEILPVVGERPTTG